MGMENSKTSLMQTVKIKTELTDEEFVKIAQDRAPLFDSVKGILQHYYIKLNEQGEYGGVYIWESWDALEEFRRSNLAAMMPIDYKLLEPPTYEIVEVLFRLKD